VGLAALRARALRARIFLGSLVRKTGRCVPIPTPHPRKILCPEFELGPHGLSRKKIANSEIWTHDNLGAPSENPSTSAIMCFVFMKKITFRTICQDRRNEYNDDTPHNQA
jgi:hypothetical protein